MPKEETLLPLLEAVEPAGTAAMDLDYLLNLYLDISNPAAEKQLRARLLAIENEQSLAPDVMDAVWKEFGMERGMPDYLNF
jgi:hypothetical protein